jgi:hypothetical protein
LHADVLLVEHNEEFDKDSLKKLYNKNINQFKLCSGSTTEIWSLDDNTALTTSLEIKNRGRLLDITISKVNRYNCTRTPAHVDIEK